MDSLVVVVPGRHVSWSFEVSGRVLVTEESDGIAEALASTSQPFHWLIQTMEKSLPLPQGSHTVHSN